MGIIMTETPVPIRPSVLHFASQSIPRLLAGATAATMAIVRGFAVCSFLWGSPHYYQKVFTMIPLLAHPYYDNYWYDRGYLSYTYWKFYGNYGAGYYYDDQKRDRNTRYAPRSVGTNRVVNGTDQSRDARLSGREASQNGSNRPNAIGGHQPHERIPPTGEISRNDG
ncbi:MAG: hypothetical protein U5J63_08590 [Fodinibius sp.]|nr:hypothetical protein [Fodinibius sp.]